MGAADKGFSYYLTWRAEARLSLPSTFFFFIILPLKVLLGLKRKDAKVLRR